MSVMPGVAWRPITVPGGSPRRTSKGRAVVLHVAASEATSLFGFFNNNPNANSHFYVARDGTTEQYVDTDYQSWASMAANASTISVETQGGVTNPDAEPWTPQQIAALGRICAWAHATESTPLVPMPNSLPASRGVGYHRLGIDPWRVPGGELWSGSRGKLCPGAAKVAQIPAVIAAALGGNDMPLTEPEKTELVNRTADAIINRVIVGKDVQLWQVLGAIYAKTYAERHDLGGRPVDGMDDLFGHVLSTEARVKALATAPSAAVNVDPAALAAALLADEASVARLGDAIAAGLAKRVGNG